MLVVTLCIMSTSETNAGITNGGFETGTFSGWTTTGSASIKTASFGVQPAEGRFQALLTNSSPAVPVGSVESFLGLASGSLNSLGEGTVTNGSALKQTFTVTSGGTVSFSRDFLTNEDTPSTTNDFAFVSLTSLRVLADTNTPNFIPSNTSFIAETGYQTETLMISTAGTYTLGFGVVNVGDTSVSSGLLVDNVTFSPSSAVPEPSSLIMSAIGALGVLTILARTSRRRSRNGDAARINF